MATEQQKADALRELTEVSVIAQKHEANAKNLARQSRAISDAVPAVCNIISETPAENLAVAELSETARAAREYIAKANQIDELFKAAMPFTAISSMIINTASTAAFSGIVYANLSPRQIQTVDENKDHLSKALDIEKQRVQVNGSFHRLGLNMRTGNGRIPADFLEESAAALAMPGVEDGRPTSVLIPLRECINAMLAMLLQRRPKQELGGKANEKIESIGNQCGRGGLVVTHFVALGKNAVKLLDDLSGFKQKSLSRRELMGYYHRGLSFLNAFMDSIDESKLKSVIT
jgi:hypothetical protein